MPTFSAIDGSSSSSLTPRYVSALAIVFQQRSNDVGASHKLGAIFAGIFFFLYIVLFCTTIVVQRKRRLDSPTIWLTLIAVFLLTSTEFSMQMFEAYLGLVRAPDPTDVFGNATNPFQATRSILLAVALILTESVLLWRLYYIWRGEKVVLVVNTFFFAIGVVAMSVVGHWQIQALNAGTIDQFKSSIHYWQVMNVYATALGSLILLGLVAWKMWRLYHDRAPSRLDLLIAIALESGVPILVTLIVLMITYKANSRKGTQVMVYIFPYIVAIAPTLIILTLQAVVPPPPVIKPEIRLEDEDGLSIKCHGLDEEEEEKPIRPPRPERRGYI